MNKERENIKKLSESFASEIKKLEVLVASDPQTSDKQDPATRSQIQSCMEAMYSISRNLHDRIDGMYNDMYAYMQNHNKGHLPPSPSPEHTEKALKALGWDKNFNVEKKTIWASKNLFEIKANKK